MMTLRPPRQHRVTSNLETTYRMKENPKLEDCHSYDLGGGRDSFGGIVVVLIISWKRGDCLRLVKVQDFGVLNTGLDVLTGSKVLVYRRHVRSEGDPRGWVDTGETPADKRQPESEGHELEQECEEEGCEADAELKESTCLRVSKVSQSQQNELHRDNPPMHQKHIHPWTPCWPDRSRRQRLVQAGGQSPWRG